MKLRHIKDSSGARRVRGVSTEPGDEVDVGREIGRRLVQYPHLELAEEDLCTESVDGFICGRDEPCQYHGGDE